MMTDCCYDAVVMMGYSLWCSNVGVVMVQKRESCLAEGILPMEVRTTMATMATRIRTMRTISILSV
jgi:hypothetical protein